MVEMTPEEMDAREQEEFNTGPLRLGLFTFRFNPIIRVVDPRPPPPCVKNVKKKFLFKSFEDIFKHNFNVFFFVFIYDETIFKVRLG